MSACLIGILRSTVCGYRDSLMSASPDIPHFADHASFIFSDLNYLFFACHSFYW